MADAFQPPAQIKPDQIFEIIVRRRWFIVIPLCITLTLGLFATLVAQKTYQATTLILVQQQSVPTAYIKSVVSSSINQRISTISQQILSRSNLEKIIHQFGLYENTGNMYLEDKIASMRNRVQVKIERTRQGAEAFSIIFKGSNPQKVMQIANTLASFFMDENLKVREAQAIGTSEFLESELEKTRHRLEERERKLAKYRSKYLGGLPDELETNLRTLDRLQEQMANKHNMLRETKISLSLLETQIAQARKVSSKNNQASVSLGGNENGADGIPTETELFLAEKQHAELLGSYTSKHPDVVRLEKRIENLKTTLAQERAATQKQNSIAPGQSSDTMENSAIQQMKISRTQQINDIQRIKFDIQEIEKKNARVSDPGGGHSQAGTRVTIIETRL